MDVIEIRDLVAFGVLGVEERERREPREVRVSIRLSLDLRAAGAEDSLRKTVDYRVLSEEIVRHIQTSRRFTVEALAGDVARICLSREAVRQVLVRLEKPGAVPQARTVAVEIVRSRDDFLDRAGSRT